MKISTVQFFLALVGVVVFQGFSFAADTALTEKVARELLEVSGATKMAPAVTEQLIQQQRKMMPDIPEAFWKEFLQEVDPEELNKKMTGIYAKHFSMDEMKKIIAFYKTEAGKKFTTKLPEIAQESRGVFREWTMALRMRITKKLEKTDLKKMRENP
ncbi:MAG: DUF2059 domain-containing protein [Nitrospiria bacterium]